MEDSNILDKIDKYEKQILDEPDYIMMPMSYIYDMTEIEINGELTEYLRAIAYRNAQLIVEKKTRVDEMRKKLDELKPIVEPVDESVVEEDVTVPSEKHEESKNTLLPNIIQMLEVSLFDDDTEKMLENLSNEDRIKIKLYFLKKINMLTRQIRNKIIGDPTTNIGDLQEQIVQCELVMELLNSKEKTVSDDIDSSNELSNIILVPDLKNKNSYLYEDILKYLDSRKEIKIVIDKILLGYFLKTKDTRIIESYKSQKLYEYKLPNGIRVLYIVNGGYIFICSLFFKDKQKSIKINNYYEDAVNRYLGCLEYLNSNLNEPDFYIEQDEYVANINSLLEPEVTMQKRMVTDNE